MPSSFKQLSGAALLLLSLGLSGCQYKTRSAANPHSTQKPQSIGQNELNVQSSEDAKKIQQGSAPTAPSELDFSKVEAQVLNLTTLLEKSSLANQDLVAKLDWYNGEFIKRAKAKQLSTTSMSKYLNSVLYGCSLNLVGCRSHTFLSRSALSYRVAMILAQENSHNLYRYYQLLNVAYTLKNRIYDFDLSYLYLQKADAYIQLIQKNEAQYQYFLSTLQTIILELSVSATPEQARKGIELFSPLTLSRKSAGVSSKLSLANLFAISAKLGMFYNQSDLSAPLKKVLVAAKNQPDGFWQRQSVLLKKSNLALSLGEIKPLSELNEYFFLIDRVFNHELLVEDGAALWQGIKKQDRHQQLVETLRSYVKIQFMHYLRQTNQKAKEVFSRELSSDQVLTYAISHSYEISSIWSQYRSQMKPLSNFVISVLQADHADKNILAQAKDIVDGLESNIKISSTYPHMMMIAYLMSLKDFKKEYRTRWGYAIIDSAIVLNNVFTGAEKPEWLDYSEDHEPLNQNEVIYAFDIAIKTGALEAFGINPDQFLKQIFVKLQTVHLNKIEEFENYMNSTWASSDFLKEWNTICQNLKANKPARRTIKNIDSLIVSPFIADKVGPLFSSQDSALQPSNSAAGGTSIYGYDPAEFLEMTRLSLLETERLMRALMLAFESSNQKVDLRLAKKELDRVKDIKVRFGNALLDYHHNLGKSCYTEILRIEFETASKILQREEQYLRGVYRDIQLLKSEPNQTIKAGIFQKYQKQLGPVRSQDRISADGYRINLIDLTFRVIDYLKDIRPELEVPVPSNLNSNMILKGNSFRYLQGIGSEDQFVKEGLAAGFFASGRGPLLLWYTNTFPLYSYSLKGYMNTLLGLYKLQPKDGVNFGFGISKAKAITPQHLIQEFGDWMTAFNLSAEDRRYLSQTQIRSKFRMLYFSEVFYRTDNAGLNVIETFGLFDYLLEGTQQEVLGTDFRNYIEGRDGGTVTPPIHVTPTQAAIDYLNIRREASKRIYFKTASEIDAYLFASYKEVVVRDQELADNFKAALDQEINAIQKLPLEQQPYFDVDQFTSIKGHFISPIIQANYDKNRKHFNETTESCFVANSVCKAF